jgi:hypothetical protein
LGYWEKQHFAEAIVNLGQNINSPHPTTFWLSACLVNLEDIFHPAAERNENYTSREERIDSLTYERIKADVAAMRLLS